MFQFFSFERIKRLVALIDQRELTKARLLSRQALRPCAAARTTLLRHPTSSQNTSKHQDQSHQNAITDKSVCATDLRGITAARGALRALRSFANFAALSP